MANMETPGYIVQQLSQGRRQLRVALVTETYPPEVNGVAMTIGRMVEGLLARGHRVQLIRPRQSAADAARTEPQLEEVLGRGVPIPRYAGLRMGLPAKRQLVRLWSHRRPDLVHVVTEGPLGWSAIAAARHLHLPVASDFHTNFHSYSRHYGLAWLRHPIAAYLRRFHNRTDLTLVPTQALAEQLSHLGYRNVAVVARGVDTALFSPGKRSENLRAIWGAGPDDLVVSYVGRLAPEKNLPLVFRAFDALQARHPGARLLLVGDGPERAALGVPRQGYHYAGQRTGEDLAAHYASSDLFLFPSLTETFGNVTAEALASGVPVVAYDYAAAAELILPERNGVRVTVGNEEAFIAAACRLAGDACLRRAMGDEAARRAARYDWNDIHNQFAGLIAEMVDQHERKNRAQAFVFAPD